jgi:hypothetical protein
MWSDDGFLHIIRHTGGGQEGIMNSTICKLLQFVDPVLKSSPRCNMSKNGGTR